MALRRIRWLGIILGSAAIVLLAGVLLTFISFVLRGCANREQLIYT